MLEIKNLHVNIDDTPILKGFNLTVNRGEIHAIMGPNGAGKSTLAKVIAGHPSYDITEGDILFDGESILELEPEERSHLGLFMSFQYPVEISGVSNFQFLYHIVKVRSGDSLSEEDFQKQLQKIIKEMHIKEEFLERDVNGGFSGGEKKRNEILQMALLKPKLAILDETDSGLDIDAMRIIAEGVNRQHTQDNALILITHYQRLLDYIKPHYVHIVKEGRIIQTGNHELAQQLEETGYALC